MKKTLSVLVIALTFVIVGCSDSTNSGGDSSAQFTGDIKTVFPAQVHFAKIGVRIVVGGEKMGGQERDNVTFTRGEVLTGESLKPGEIYNILRHYQGKNRAELIERQYKDVAFTTYTDKSSEGYDFHIEVTVGRFPSAAAANEVLEIFQSEEDSDNRLWTKGNLLFRAKNSRDFKF